MNDAHARKPRFRFADFVVSPSRRLLLRRGKPVPLIPRYFDLLLLLLERRNEAPHRREILDEVWSDVVVSDGALNQAVRVLRRALEDDPRNPVFIRTVSRHGYRFIYGDVIEEADDAAMPRGGVAPSGAAAADLSPQEIFEDAIAKLLSPDGDDDEKREAAETLHSLGTGEALRWIGRRAGHARARALLRDTRWTVPGAGPVPIFGQPGSITAAWHVVRMRVQRALRLGGSRWVSAIVGGALSGLVAGAIVGIVVRFGPGSYGVASVLVAFPVVEMTLGAVGGCGVGGGLAAAEAVARTWRGPALVVFAAAGGGLMGFLTHWFGLIALQSLFGGNLSALGGGFEGLVLGGAIGLGYALATPTVEGGMATPRGASRLLVGCVAGTTSGVAAAILASTGSYLGTMSLEFMARRFPGSDVGLAPLARLLGEAEPGWLTSVVISVWDGFMFGLGVVLGLTRRPR